MNKITFEFAPKWLVCGSCQLAAHLFSAWPAAAEYAAAVADVNREVAIAKIKGWWYRYGPGEWVGPFPSEEQARRHSVDPTVLSEDDDGLQRIPVILKHSLHA